VPQPRPFARCACAPTRRRTPHRISERKPPSRWCWWASANELGAALHFERQSHTCRALTTGWVALFADSVRARRSSSSRTRRTARVPPSSGTSTMPRSTVRRCHPPTGPPTFWPSLRSLGRPPSPHIQTTLPLPPPCACASHDTRKCGIRLSIVNRLVTRWSSTRPGCTLLRLNLKPAGGAAFLPRRRTFLRVSRLVASRRS
jgi:hypothetical protein